MLFGDITFEEDRVIIKYPPGWDNADAGKNPMIQDIFNERFKGEEL